MSDPWRRDRIEGWVGDFCQSPVFEAHGGPAREYAPEILGAFLRAACDARGVGPEAIEEADVRAGLLEGASRVELPASVREGVPALCAVFLADLEAQGRLGGGRTLGAFARALREPYLAAASGKGTTIRSPAAKIGRNDPCPCGSGLKYKRCCQPR